MRLVVSDEVGTEGFEMPVTKRCNSAKDFLLTVDRSSEWVWLLAGPWPSVLDNKEDSLATPGGASSLCLPYQTNTCTHTRCQERSGAAADDPGLHGLIPLLREEMNLILRDSSHIHMNNKGDLCVFFVHDAKKKKKELWLCRWYFGDVTNDKMSIFGYNGGRKKKNHLTKTKIW